MSAIEDHPKVEKSPMGLRAAAAIRRMGVVRGRHRLVAMSAHGLRTGTRYTNPDGFVLAIDADDPWQVHMLAGVFSSLVVAVIRKYARPGSTVIDGGAHYGYVSLQIGRAVGPSGTVHSFECDPRLAPRLRDHIEWNNATNVHAHEMALIGGDVDSIELVLAAQVGWSTVASSSLAAGVAIAGRTQVSATTVDRFVASHNVLPKDVSLVKLDVEGCEIPVLEGMRNLLAEGSPAVLVEWIPDRLHLDGYDTSALPEFLMQLGYRAWLPTWTPRLGNYDAFRLSEYDFAGDKLVDLLLLKE